MSAYHQPVLLKESIDALEVKTDGIYVDATFGGGGHSGEILKRLGKKGKLLIFDKDPDALANVPDDKRVIVAHGDFRFLSNFLKYNDIVEIDGIIADFGVSSHQFDTSERGFSFRFEASLDMRMNQSAKIDAAHIVNEYDRERLTAILRNWGELDQAYRLAGLICEYREKQKIETTTDLNSAIERALPKNNEHKFLAKVYQALRIEVNQELKSIEHLLISSPKALRTGGRLSLITYHSLEDRIVKNFIKSGNISGEIEKDMYGNIYSPFINITRKPITPGQDEIERNSRARSAKLRVAQKR